LAAAAGLSVVAAMSGAAATGDDSGSSVARFAKIDPALLESVGTPASCRRPQRRTISVVIEMAGAPVAVQDANAASTGRS
jgi:hypothetical protein